MWSQFTATRQEGVAAAAEAEEVLKAQQMPQLERDEQISIGQASQDEQDDNGWNDDSFDMDDDDQFDAIIEGDARASDPNGNSGLSSNADGWEVSPLDNDSDELNKPLPEARDNDAIASDLQTNGVATTGGVDMLGKAAENFGAALLASLDGEEQDQQEQQQSSGGGGFGAGFVMKGLSRFIEAATVPQEEYEEEDHDNNFDGDKGDGWDDDHLDVEDDDFLSDQFPREDAGKTGNDFITQNLVEEGKDEVIATENGWDDDDVDINDGIFESEETTGEMGASGGSQLILNNYELEKDKSPEPVVKRDNAEERSASLPHQESWYVNAMEDGQGGVVYSEKTTAINNCTPVPVGHSQNLNNTEQGTESSVRGEISSDLGMPISEMPSANTSPRSNSKENIAPITKCELNCECLKLIMPLPETTINNGMLPENDGFGTKQLPDGTTVLVNYEQLLLNEATKRILLERTAECYERTILSLRTKQQATAQSKVALEDKENLLNSQLAVANNEIAELKALVSNLQHEKEQPASESHLFEAELTAANTEKEKLNHQVISLEGQLKSKEDEALSLQSNLAEVRNESMTFQSQMKLLQRECDKLQEELGRKSDDVIHLNKKCSEMFEENSIHSSEAARLKEKNESLKDKVDSLQANLDTKAKENEILIIQVSESFADSAAKVKEYEQSCARLKNDLSEAIVQREVLREENESLCNIQRESDSQIIELRAMIESIDGEAAEANHSVAEIAKLRYELETKVVECQETNSEKDRMEHELADAKAELSAMREQNDELRTTIEAMDNDNGEINHLAAEVANLKYDLEAKVTECEHSTAEKSQLESTLVELKDEVKILRKENESLRQIQRDADVQINDLRATVEAMDGDADEMNELVAEVADLKYQLEAKVIECSEITAERNRIDVQQSEANAKLTTLKNENDTIRRVQRDSDAQLNELRATVESLKNDTSEMNSIKAGITELKRDLEAKVTEHNDNMNALQELQAKLDNAEECLKETMNGTSGGEEDTLRAQNYELNRRNVDLQDQLTAFESSKSDLFLALEDKIRAIESLELQIKSLNSQLLEASHLQQEMMEVRESFEEKSQQCETISRKVDELQVELVNARREHDEAMKQTSKMNSITVQGLEERLTDVTSQITNLSTQLESSKTECARFVDAIATLEKEKNQLSSMLESVNAELAEKQKQASNNIDLIKKEMESVIARNDELTETNQVILEEKAYAAKALKSKTSEFEQELSRCNASMETMKSEIESVTQQSKELTERNQSLLLEKEGAIRALASKTTDFERERKLFETSRMANSDAQQSISNLEKQLQDLRASNQRLESELFETSFAADKNEALLREKDNLEREAHALREQVGILSSQVASASKDNDAFSVEREGLLSRINKLEKELLACENVVDLRDEMTSMQEEREQLDLDNEELLVQLGLMQQDKLENEAARQVEIDGLREQISNLNDKCDRLQNDLNSSLAKDNSEVIECLQEEIQQLKGNAATFSKNMSLLKLKLADKDSEVLSVKEQLKNTLSEKDKEIEKLNQDKEVLMRAAERLSHSEEAHEEIQDKSLNQDQSSVKEEEEKEYCSGDEDDDISLQGLLAEEVDSDDFLRSQIVVLAQALERAELRRATTLERMVSERKSNADIVSQLGLSVKRFYSTIRRSEGL